MSASRHANAIRPLHEIDGAAEYAQGAEMSARILTGDSCFCRRIGDFGMLFARSDEDSTRSDAAKWSMFRHVRRVL